MPTMQDSVSVAANAVSANVVAGQLYEFANPGQITTLSVTGAATGLRCSLSIGGIAVVQDQAINLQNRFPLIPDDIMDVAKGLAGRIILTARNTTGAAIVFFWRLDID
jgi:hypothetical protein